MKNELLKGLSEEQIAKVKACKSQEEFLALAKEEGVELTDEQLKAVNGGSCLTSTPTYKNCLTCGSPNVKVYRETDQLWNSYFRGVCSDCGKVWYLG